jgi:hypothetical protein
MHCSHTLSNPKQYVSIYLDLYLEIAQLAEPLDPWFILLFVQFVLSTITDQYLYLGNKKFVT